jgi:Mg-chelatase subunit ChlD
MLPPFITSIPGAKVAFSFLFKPIKYFIDSQFRAHVTPMPGSIVYADLYFAVEHSGVHVSDGAISNIEVEGVADGAVRLCSPASFVSKSVLGKKIYVSCDKAGVVGHADVAGGAHRHVGERSFYGLVIKNCHQFSEKCVHYAQHGYHGKDFLASIVPDMQLESWEPTFMSLKNAARKRLNATKWRLWDWQGNGLKEAEPDYDAIQGAAENMPLTRQAIRQLRHELAEAQDYEEEISDEDIPADVRGRVTSFRKLLQEISTAYDQAQPLMKGCPDAEFSYAQLKVIQEDLPELAAILASNPGVQELVRKMGRDHISEEEKKKPTRVARMSQSEVHGTRLSNEIMRMLPQELLNLDDDSLEHLFYARLLEGRLQTYELSGITNQIEETTEKVEKTTITGPVVALLDTSGSMRGAALTKARVLLLAVANSLAKEKRSLHVVLFGGKNELHEFSMTDARRSAELLIFLKHGFDGGTSFETPLSRAFQIIEQEPDYLRADVLMISDGDCTVSDSFRKTIQEQKTSLDCRIYSVLCHGTRVNDNFSDEVVVL